MKNISSILTTGTYSKSDACSCFRSTLALCAWASFYCVVSCSMTACRSNAPDYYYVEQQTRGLTFNALFVPLIQTLQPGSLQCHPQLRHFPSRSSTAKVLSVPNQATQHLNLHELAQLPPRNEGVGRATPVLLITMTSSRRLPAAALSTLFFAMHASAFRLGVNAAGTHSRHI